MKKFKSLSLLFVSLFLIACSSNSLPVLEGLYQSDRVDGYIVQIAIQPEDNSFIEYIDNREVDQGTYKKKSEDIYQFMSDKQDFEIILTTKDTFEVRIKKINNNKPLELKNVDKVPTYFNTKFDDVEEFKKLLI
ncbi:hypothetical protein [Facklamia miroungae]|uniref:DUF4825 domain-containing protein n=1 Tax=Facklamia miroungae TaxID=120956 RepID=A0A1G7UB05_9LACT|nr:hypothetical protein [Facklamia miroungae]NKZ30040.1 hypothetical protein [Facklamia miroungae]SDG44756.1 hypothetical protein SAMN05421791_10928 [Facklamia miroungae]